MEKNTIQKVVGWTLFWFTLYYSCFKVLILKKKHVEYNCRIITLIHAIAITATSCIITFFTGTNPFDMLGYPNTISQELIIQASLGYFFFDFMWCIYHQSEEFIMLLHHIISITFMLVCLILGVSGTEVVATIFGSEVTSIVLNIRWFMKEHRLYDNTMIGFYIDMTFVILFVVVRMGVGGSLMFYVLMSNRSPWLVKVGGSCFYTVNCLFFAQILSFARYRFKKWRKRSLQSGETQLGATSCTLNGACESSLNGSMHQPTQRKKVEQPVQSRSDAT